MNDITGFKNIFKKTLEIKDLKLTRQLCL